MPIKGKPAAQGRASGVVLAGERDSRKLTPTTDENQDRWIYDGRDFLGVVRELPSGGFVAVFDEMVLGPHPTIKAATDALLDIAQPRGGQ